MIGRFIVVMVTNSKHWRHDYNNNFDFSNWVLRSTLICLIVRFLSYFKHFIIFIHLVLSNRVLSISTVTSTQDLSIGLCTFTFNYFLSQYQIYINIKVPNAILTDLHQNQKVG